MRYKFVKEKIEYIKPLTQYFNEFDDKVFQNTGKEPDKMKTLLGESPYTILTIDCENTKSLTVSYAFDIIEALGTNTIILMDGELGFVKYKIEKDQ